jgi:8-oxo-dGTP pyrophosphatase MutT (NUDIX family)
MPSPIPSLAPLASSLPTLSFDTMLCTLIRARLQRWPVQSTSSQGLKRAAVSVIVVDDGTGQAALLVTRRASSLSSHAGQYALPGGRVDPHERALDAALRETHEEIGLQINESAVLGQLDDYTTRSGYLITPFVVWAEDLSQMRASPNEVAAIYRVPIRDLSKPGSPEFISIAESDRLVIRYPILGTLIHAPTAAVMYQFMEVAIADRATRVHDLEQAVFAWK